VFLTSDNADGQAGLLLGRDRLIRLDPGAAAKDIDLDDWQRAAEILPTAAKSIFQEKKTEIESFLKEKVSPRGKFYSPEGRGVSY
jgi:hypothetical protein